jgi:hypothetical protein
MSDLMDTVTYTITLTSATHLMLLQQLLLSRLRNFVIIRAPWLKNLSLKAKEARIPRYFRARLANIGNLIVLDF